MVAMGNRVNLRGMDCLDSKGQEQARDEDGVDRRTFGEDPVLGVAIVEGARGNYTGSRHCQQSAERTEVEQNGSRRGVSTHETERKTDVNSNLQSA